jgi:hypothetical protein
VFRQCTDDIVMTLSKLFLRVVHIFPSLPLYFAILVAIAVCLICLRSSLVVFASCVLFPVIDECPRS